MATAVTLEEREAQKKYWLEHSAQPTVEAMMLDTKAAVIDQLERPEVLSTLGSVKGQRVLELGAGIGRFTGELAKTASSVLACDFMDVSIAENRKTNGHLGNCDFQVADVTSLTLPEKSFDVVFSNWLLMYLSDKEVSDLASRAISWLTDGGTLFFRESCFRQSGDMARSANPTHYRNPRDYFAIFDGAEWRDESGAVHHLELVLCKCVDTYVQVKRNQNQICWKWKKVISPTGRQPLYRQFLDKGQYSATSIAQYEQVFGTGFVSPGGLVQAAALLPRLQLQPDQRVLDVGCGPGGAAFHISQNFNVHVHGIDLSVNMVLLALERAAASTSSSSNGSAAAQMGAANGSSAVGSSGSNGGPRYDVTFEVADVMARDFPPDSFDAIHSRDALLHLFDKPKLFKRLYSWLKPGGRLLITDYCTSSPDPDSFTPGFRAYIQERGYHLMALEAYQQLLCEAGFKGVVAEDRTQEFIGTLQEELVRLEAGGMQQLDEERRRDMVEGWRAKLERAKSGEQRWGLFVGTK